jgi:hypothetical protein
MTFTLHVDAPRWRKHLDSVVNDYSQSGATVSPVIKGNGYGFGRTTLCNEVSRLQLSSVCVGTIFEAEEALARFAGDVIVMEPFSELNPRAVEVWVQLLQNHSSRLIAIIATNEIAALSHAGVTRAYIEGLSSMRRFGLTLQDLDNALGSTTNSIAIEGLWLHLPIAEPAAEHVAVYEPSPNDNSRKLSGHAREVLGWISWYRDLANKYSLPMHVSVSHVDAKDAKVISQSASTFDVKVRVGTSLWLGDRKSLRVTGTVLAVHDAGLGHDAVGYTQTDSHGHKKVIVVSGGTSHGVALAAPANVNSVRKRGIAIAEGMLEAMGKVKSPFARGGDKLVFAEPPHMHASMLWCEDSSIVVGGEIECTIRNTTASFDAIVGLT